MHTVVNQQWIAHCIARVLTIDPVAEVALLMPILEEMAANEERYGDREFSANTEKVAARC